MSPEAMSLRILIVDDNEDFVEMASLLLQLEGHRVATAKDGPSAILRAMSFEPDVMLLDLSLPEVNGYTVCQRLRERPSMAQTMFIAISGWVRLEDKARAREAGFDHFLAKPADAEALKALVRLQAQKLQEKKGR